MLKYRLVWVVALDSQTSTLGYFPGIHQGFARRLDLRRRYSHPWKLHARERVENALQAYWLRHVD